MSMSSSETADWPIQPAQSRDSLPFDDPDELSSSTQGQLSEVSKNSKSSGKSSPNTFSDIDHPASGSVPLGSDYIHVLPPWPSKYNGPSSTWRTWTAGDRAIAASLDQLRATDLSLHLYNAYALKKRAAKLKATSDHDVEEDANTWHPAKQWTAWPMLMEEVPRNVEQLLDEKTNEEVYRNTNEDSRPSAEMMDSLNAILLKQAKLRLSRRESQEKGHDSRSSLRNEDVQASSPKSDESNVESFQDEMYVEKPDLQPEDTRETRLHGRVYKLVSIADDELAANILQSSVRHTLTKLDDLLMGLHHSRHAYLHRLDKAKRNKRSDVDERESLSASSGPRVSGRESQSQLRTKRRRSTSPNSSEKEGVVLGHDSESKRRRESLSPKSKARVLRNRQNKLGLRDWGDVLGIASLTGWESSVLDRAASRCAALFDEGINFRTLPEGIDTATEKSYLPLDLESNRTDTSNPSNGYPNTPNTKSGPIRKTLSTGRNARIIDGKLYCPFSDCGRYCRGFARDWNFRQHMENVHPQEVSRTHVEIMGAVHVDGFLCPIKAHKGWNTNNLATTSRS